MSSGIIWYKTQPDSAITNAVNDLLTDYCGSVKSHHVTVQPDRIAPLLREIFLRCENIIIIGGAQCRKPEDNIVFILSHALGIPLETKYRSRSRYCYDNIRDERLPSLDGAVLFPSQPGYPEGFLLSSGNQSILVLPSRFRPAVASAVMMREYFIPEVSRRKREESSRVIPQEIQKDYIKFRRSQKAAPITREYDEYQLLDTMERALWRARGDSSDDTSFDYMADDHNRGGN